MLSDLPKEDQKNSFDIVAMHGDFKNFKTVVYDLMPDGQTYYLFSRGEDGVAFTQDDLFPHIDPAEAANIGYRERPMTPGAAAPTPNP